MNVRRVEAWLYGSCSVVRDDEGKVGRVDVVGGLVMMYVRSILCKVSGSVEAFVWMRALVL
jgi:hypothetical protein